MADADLQRPSGFPLIAAVAVGLLVLVGVFVVIGWVFSLFWALIRLVVLGVIVVGLIAGARWALTRR